MSDDAGMLPFPISRLPLPVFHLASCIMQSAAGFADKDQEGFLKAG